MPHFSIKKTHPFYFERMGDCDSGYNFGNPATFKKVFGFAPDSFEQFALVGYILFWLLTNYQRSSSLLPMSKYVIAHSYHSKKGIFVNQSTIETDITA